MVALRATTYDRETSAVDSPGCDAGVARVVIVAHDHAFHLRVRRLIDAIDGVLVCGEAFDAISGTVVCALGAPDAVITDAHQSWLEVRDLVRRVHRTCPQISVLTCTIVSASETYASVLAAPAANGQPAEDLVHALGRVRRGPETTSVPGDTYLH